VLKQAYLYMYEYNDNCLDRVSIPLHLMTPRSVSMCNSELESSVS
jgi:hypothetical protein